MLLIRGCPHRSGRRNPQKMSKSSGSDFIPKALTLTMGLVETPKELSGEDFIDKSLGVEQWGPEWFVYEYLYSREEAITKTKISGPFRREQDADADIDARQHPKPNFCQVSA